MTLSFPSSPINGAISGDYTYDASKTAWRKNGLYPVSVTHSDVPPSNPRAGDQWWKSNEGTLFTYYSDGNSYQWVESTNVIANVEPNPIPAGAMMAWASDVIPANWLLCDGTAVSRSTYASLFAIIGTQYGSGDGTTTFNLPNLKGRTIVGKDGSQTEFDVLGETGGAKTHTLTTAEMPSHTHIQDSHNHTQNAHGHSINDPGHMHYMDQGPYTGGGNYTPPGSDNRYQGNAPTRSSTTGISINNATATNQATTATNQSTGGGGAHNNLQPYIVLNYIIKYSAGETPGDSQLAVRVGALETQNNATPLSQNYLINGAMDFWQRGTSFSSAGYTADRWATVAASGQTVASSQQAFTAGTAPVAGYEGQYFLRTTWSGTPSGTFWLTQRVEDVRTLAGQTVTLSFWAKATSATSAFTSVIETNFGSGGSAGTSLVGPTLNITTSWARYSTTFTLGSISGKTIGTNSYLDVRPLNAGSSVAGNAIDIWGVQLEAGSYATPFRRNAPSIQAELAACQRYYVRYTSADAYGLFATASVVSGTYAHANFSLHVPMRAAPSTVEVPSTITNLKLTNIATTNWTISAIQLGYAQPSFCSLLVTSSGMTTGQAIYLSNNNTTAGYIGFSAEL